MPVNNRKFRKEERLCSQKIIGSLFLSGTMLKRFPLKVIYEQSAYSGSPVKIVVSVPKKIHGKAVKRNHIRRKIREACRLKKNILYEFIKNKDYTLNVIFIYIASNIFAYAEIEEKIERIFKELGENLKKNNDSDTGAAD